MLDYEEVKQALSTNTYAASVLRDVLEGIVEITRCYHIERFWFNEAPNECGKCLYCLAKKALEECKDAA